MTRVLSKPSLLSNPIHAIWELSDDLMTKLSEERIQELIPTSMLSSSTVWTDEYWRIEGDHHISFHSWQLNDDERDLQISERPHLEFQAEEGREDLESF